MSYGFLAINSAGETVIDDTYAAHFISSATTVSGSARPAPYTNQWTYPAITSGAVRFWQLSVGDKITVAPDGSYIANKSSFSVRDTLPASLISAPTGYGMAIYNSSSNLMYASSSDMMSIGDRYLVGTTSISVSQEWVAVDRYELNYVNPFSGIIVVLSTGVERDTSTTYKKANFDWAAFGGGGVFVSNASFVTAK